MDAPPTVTHSNFPRKQSNQPRERFPSLPLWREQGRGTSLGSMSGSATAKQAPAMTG